jgi:hypothetical protein
MFISTLMRQVIVGVTAAAAAGSMSVAAHSAMGSGGGTPPTTAAAATSTTMRPLHLIDSTTATVAPKPAAVKPLTRNILPPLCPDGDQTDVLLNASKDVIAPNRVQDLDSQVDFTTDAGGWGLTYVNANGALPDEYLLWNCVNGAWLLHERGEDLNDCNLPYPIYADFVLVCEPDSTTTTTTAPARKQLQQSRSTSGRNNVRPPIGVTTTTITPPLVLRKNPGLDGPTPDELADEFMQFYANGYGAKNLAPYTTAAALAEAQAIDFNLALGITFPGDCTFNSATTVCKYVSDNGYANGTFTLTVDNPSELITSFVYTAA